MPQPLHGFARSYELRFNYISSRCFSPLPSFFEWSGCLPVRNLRKSRNGTDLLRRPGSAEKVRKFRKKVRNFFLHSTRGFDKASRFIYVPSRRFSQLPSFFEWSGCLPVQNLRKSRNGTDFLRGSGSTEKVRKSRRKSRIFSFIPRVDLMMLRNMQSSTR